MTGGHGHLHTDFVLRFATRTNHYIATERLQVDVDDAINGQYVIAIFSDRPCESGGDTACRLVDSTLHGTVTRAASGADQGHDGGSAADPKRDAGAKSPNRAQGGRKQSHGC